jgi:hypothetical protein
VQGFPLSSLGSKPRVAMLEGTYTLAHERVVLTARLSSVVSYDLSFHRTVSTCVKNQGQPYSRATGVNGGMVRLAHVNAPCRTDSPTAKPFWLSYFFKIRLSMRKKYHHELPETTHNTALFSNGPIIRARASWPEL